MAELRTELKAQQDTVLRMQREVATANNLVEQERAFALEELTRGREAQATVREENERLRKRVVKMEKWNNDIRRSASFRAGRLLAALAHPGRALRRITRRVSR